MLELFDKLRKLWRAARNKRKIPEIIEWLEQRVGSHVDAGRIVAVPNDGTIDAIHGQWRMFVYIHRTQVFYVRKYEDGYLEFVHNTDECNLQIPQKALDYLEWRLGRQVELDKITEIIGDGYKHIHHGTSRIFVYRHENLLEKVFIYEDGHIEPAYIDYRNC